MREITTETAADYLRESGRVSATDHISVRELSGGVSNAVLRVDIPDRAPFVIKQCRRRLRVAMEWQAPLERIWAEQATLELLGQILPEGFVPRVQFDDRPNYLFAMTCAPDDAVPWKVRLIAGQVEAKIAVNLGRILGTIHTECSGQQFPQGILTETSLFEELRVDPYYRTTARAHADLAQHIDILIASMDRPLNERTLVLGDFSPKNILVHSAGLILLDFECAHGGDPAFDIGFFAAHLLLKTVRAADHAATVAARYAALIQAFYGAYLERRGLDGPDAARLLHRSILHASACSLARVDGKSPVEYLDGSAKAIVRAFAREALRSEPSTWDDLLNVLQNAIDRGTRCQP
jgi:5-methylthioribose kinase